MMDFGGWNRLFSMEKPVYGDVTLEMLSTFKVNRSLIGFSQPQAIQFQIFAEPRHLSYTDFSLLLGIYDTNFTVTEQYKELAINFPPGTIAEVVWLCLNKRRSYELG